jgi:hypothetical protein
MERKATQPLNLEDAKARLRMATTGGQPLSWLWSYPKEATVAAFVIGVIVGVSPTARDALAHGIVSLLKRSRL